MARHLFPPAYQRRRLTMDVARQSVQRLTFQIAAYREALKHTTLTPAERTTAEAAMAEDFADRLMIADWIVRQSRRDEIMSGL